MTKTESTQLKFRKIAGFYKEMFSVKSKQKILVFTSRCYKNGHIFKWESASIDLYVTSFENRAFLFYERTKIDKNLPISPVDAIKMY